MFNMFEDFSGVLLMKIKSRRMRIPFDAPTIPADKRVRKMNESVPCGSEQPFIGATKMSKAYGRMRSRL